MVGCYEVRNAMYWTNADTKPVGADIPPAGFIASDVTAEGRVIVGATRAPDAPWPVVDSAFIYTPGGDIRRLGYLPGGSCSLATSVSGDGSRTAGPRRTGWMSSGSRRFGRACFADVAGDATLDLFDFLCFVNAFNRGF